MDANRQDARLDRAMRDPAFRATLRRDPEGTARALRVDVGAAEWAGLANVLRP